MIDSSAKITRLVSSKMAVPSTYKMDSLTVYLLPRQRIKKKNPQLSLRVGEGWKQVEAHNRKNE